MYHAYRLRLGGLLISIGAFICCVAAFIALAVFTGRARADVRLGLDYYFLVKECEDSTSAAVVGEVYSSGGAGYLYGDTVILACYYQKADARRVCSLMEARGEKVSVLCRSLDGITLRGEDAAFAEKVKNTASTAESVARLLYDTANALERGTADQKAAKGNVKGAADALEGLAAADSEPLFAKWDLAVRNVARAAREKSRDILFAKDVRYLQISLCCMLLDMGSYF